MNFIKSSVSHEYLYSPQSWLHKRKDITKIYIVFINLAYLPYVRIRYIYFYLLFFLLIYKSIYIPIKLNSYLCTIIFIFAFLTLINIQNKQQIFTDIVLKREYIQIHFIKRFFLSDIKEYNTDHLSYQDYYLSASLIRLLSIIFLHLTSMKILLLTTVYRNILTVFFYHANKYKNTIFQKLFFEIQLSIQFLKIIFKQIDIIKVAYITRSVKIKRKVYLLEIISLYIFCLQQLLANLRKGIYNISNTLYSCEMNKEKLNILYKTEGL